jgi:hypothetical protein
VQLDDAYWGGRRRGYKRGRGARGKTPFVAAVEIDATGRPRRMSLNRVQGFRSKEIARWGRAKLAAGTAVHSEGLACFAAVTTVGCLHTLTLMSGPGIAKRRMHMGRCGAQGALPQRACVPRRQLAVQFAAIDCADGVCARPTRRTSAQ